MSKFSNKAKHPVRRFIVLTTLLCLSVHAVFVANNNDVLVGLFHFISTVVIACISFLVINHINNKECMFSTAELDRIEGDCANTPVFKRCYLQVVFINLLRFTLFPALYCFSYYANIQMETATLSTPLYDLIKTIPTLFASIIVFVFWSETLKAFQKELRLSQIVTILSSDLGLAPESYEQLFCYTKDENDNVFMVKHACTEKTLISKVKHWE